MSDLREQVWTRHPNSEECGRTFVTLRVLSECLALTEIEARIGVARTGGSQRGEPRDSDGAPRKFTMWRLSSSFSPVLSRDTRDHLDWVLSCVTGKEQIFRDLAQEGCVVDCLVRWDSILGHGGPIFMPDQLRRLAALDAVLWLDVFVDTD